MRIEQANFVLNDVIWCGILGTTWYFGHFRLLVPLIQFQISNGTITMKTVRETKYMLEFEFAVPTLV